MGLALLYNAPRAASVKCTSTDGGELLQPLLSSELQLVDQALELKCFNKDEIIFKLGDEGDRFYIIKSGKIEGKAKDGSTFNLSDGAFFGERALLTNEPRAATITAVSATLECLT